MTIRLPEGWRSCSDCGIGVPEGSGALVVVEAIGAEGEPAASPGSLRTRSTLFEFSMCSDCTTRKERAAALGALYPHLGRQLGHEVAVHRVGLVLDACAALGVKEPIAESALNLLVSRVDVSVKWAALFAPITAVGARAGTANDLPFAHVSDSVRIGLRKAYASALKERLATRAASTGGPCCYCGIGASSSWQSVQIAPESIGGRRAPDTLAGVLCEPCAAAVDGVGAVGQTSMLRALSAYLEGAGRGDEAEQLRNFDVDLTGWAVTGLPANTEPWSFLTLVP